jgi:anti-sigma factor RsiW
MAAVPETCVAFDEDLSALLDGELTPERAGEVEAHVAACARCRAQLAAFQSVGARLRGVRRPDVPRELEARLLARVATESRAMPGPAPARGRPRRRLRARGVLAGAALAAAALALYLGVVRRPPSPVLAPPDGPVARQEPALPPPSDARAPEAPKLASELDAASDEELSLALQLETLEDLEVIANLDLLENTKAESGKDRG